jgi:hypothetical protein
VLDNLVYLTFIRPTDLFSVGLPSIYNGGIIHNPIYEGFPELYNHYSHSVIDIMLLRLEAILTKTKITNIKKYVDSTDYLVSAQYLFVGYSYLGNITINNIDNIRLKRISYYIDRRIK